MKKLLLFLFRFSPGLVLLAMAFSMLAGLANMGLLALVNRALASDALGFLPPFLLLCAAFPVLRVIATVTIAYLSEKAVFQLRIDLARKVIRAPLRHLEELGPQRVLAILTHDVSSIAAAMTSIPILAMHLTIYMTGIAYLAWLYWPGAIGVVLATGVGLSLYQLGAVRAHRHMAAARGEQDQLFGHFRALTLGNKELKLHRGRREAFMQRMLSFSASLYLKENVKGRAFLSGSASLGQAFYFLTIAAAVFGLPRWVPGLPPETTTGFALVLLYLLLPLDALASALPNLLNAAISYRTAGVLAEDLQLAQEAHTASEIQATPSKITYDALSYRYPSDEPGRFFQLGPLDVTLKAGEVVFIVGGNGSGKTTLGKLLCGLYQADSGQVQVDGAAQQADKIDCFRQHFSSVFDDFYLFASLDGVVDEQADARAQSYLEKLELQHKVTITDGRFSTVDLSKGQRKRLALLTAYLEDRPFYLFDEWAADQDPEFKSVFYEVLLPELKAQGKCVVAITHDDAYFHLADRVLKLDYGRLQDMSANARPVKG